MDSSEAPGNQTQLSNLRAGGGGISVRPPSRSAYPLDRVSPAPTGGLNRRYEQIERRRRRMMTLHAALAQRIEPSEASNKRRRLDEQAQLEMTQLQLELHFCDGGRYDGGRYDGGRYYPDYCPENALRNDTSVYCTKNPCCNMILRHVGEKCFTLQRLVIRAPPTGYSSPVREGMIFVAMNADDLITRTNYSVDYEDDLDGDSIDEYYAFGYAAPRTLDTDPCDTGQDEEEVENTTETGAASTRRTGVTSVGRSRFSSTPAPPEAPNNRDLQAPSQAATPLEPHATFFNKDMKSKCVINFEPAITGRYILAKFFSDRRDNIAIEFIGAYGHVGRRSFPAICPR